MEKPVNLDHLKSIDYAKVLRLDLTCAITTFDFILNDEDCFGALVELFSRKRDEYIKKQEALKEMEDALKKVAPELDLSSNGHG